MKYIVLTKKIGIIFILFCLISCIILFRPENIIKIRIKNKFNNDMISLSKVIVNSPSKITFQLQTYSCLPMDQDDGKVLSEFIDCINANISEFDEVIILLNQSPTYLSIKMKKYNDVLYISEFNCEYTEIYADVLSCFDLSKTAKMIYKGETIVDYKSEFSQMKELKKLSLYCRQDFLTDDLDDLIQSLSRLERLDFYVYNYDFYDKEKIENIKEKIFDLDMKYPDIIISYNYAY